MYTGIRYITKNPKNVPAKHIAVEGEKLKTSVAKQVPARQKLDAWYAHFDGDFPSPRIRAKNYNY